MISRLYLLALVIAISMTMGGCKLLSGTSKQDNSPEKWEDKIAEFEAMNNAKVEYLPSGDAGTALNQAILSKNNPLADVFFGVDNTFLGRALDNDIVIEDALVPARRATRIDPAI